MNQLRDRRDRMPAAHRIAVAAMLVLLMPLGGCGRNEPAAAAEATRESPAALPGLPVPDAEPLIRVRVKRVREPGGSMMLGEPGRWMSVGPVDDRSRRMTLQAPLALTCAGDHWTIVDQRGLRRGLDGFRRLEIGSLDPAHPFVSIDERRHPGSMRLVSRDDLGSGCVDAVNHVLLEAYLPGVVARELYRHWHPEAFKAQVIAARSYAAAQQAEMAGRRHYDLTNTTRSQVYAGSVDSERASQAARETRGIVLTWNGRLVPGYYSSCCGGLPATAVDAIGENRINDLPPLEGPGPDSACVAAPVYTWQVRHQIGPLSGSFADYGSQRGNEVLAAIGRITAIEIATRNEHGRPLGYRLVDDAGGDVVIASDEFRAAMNFARGDLSRLKSSYVLPRIEDGLLILDGRGFGHGVGLCQYGAQSRATSGELWDDIVRWYYPGAELTRAYE